jgi:hypothetical protein
VAIIKLNIFLCLLNNVREILKYIVFVNYFNNSDTREFISSHGNVVFNTFTNKREKYYREN